MYLPSALTNLLTLVPQFTFQPSSQTNLLNPLTPSQTNRVPTRDESTVLARRLLALSRTATISTIFPSNSSLALSGSPIALPEYIADCEHGDPTILALTISTTTRNAIAGSNVSLSISWWDEYKLLTGREYWSMANLPRASLIGWLQEMSQEEVRDGKVVECFVKKHRDAGWWLPGGNGPHEGKWMRLVVEQIYWVGGFGDRAYIGWFDVDVWRSVGRQWEDVRLPGEKD